MQNREDDIFKDGSGRLERFLIPDMNIELIEMIARGRLEHKTKRQADNFKPPADTNPRKESTSKIGNPETSKDAAPSYNKLKDEVLGASIDHSEGERDEEAYLDKILNDNQYLIDVSAADNRLKRQGTMRSLMSSEYREQGSAELEGSMRIKEQEQARQEALYKLYHQIVMDNVLKRSVERDKTPQQMLADTDAITEIKLECIRGFKALQHLRIPTRIINDNFVLEEMLKSKLKQDFQDEKVKNLMGNHVPKGREGIQVSQSLISLSAQLQPGFSGTGALPPSRLMDLNRRNKLLSTHEALNTQIQQSARYLYSSRSKLEKLTQAHKKLIDAYQIKKEQIVEKIRRINKAMKRLREKVDLKHFERNEHLFSPQKRTTKFFKDNTFTELTKEVSGGKGAESEASSPARGNHNASFTQLKPTNSNSVNESSRISPSKNKGNHDSQFSLLEEASEDDDMFGEGAKQMVKRYVASNGGVKSNQLSDVIFEILKGDLKRTKLMTEKQLEGLIEHQKENLSIKKDYLESLSKYVTSLEDTLNKAQRKQRNMYLFLLEHPKDITYFMLIQSSRHDRSRRLEGPPSARRRRSSRQFLIDIRREIYQVLVYCFGA